KRVYGFARSTSDADGDGEEARGADDRESRQALSRRRLARLVRVQSEDFDSRRVRQFHRGRNNQGRRRQGGGAPSMKILVPVKRVVDYSIKIRIKADGSGVELANIKMSVNPFDEIAVEEALRQKEAGKATEVVIVSIGPDRPDAGGADRLRPGHLRLEGRRRRRLGRGHPRGGRRPADGVAEAAGDRHRRSALERAALCFASQHHEGEEEADRGEEPGRLWRRRRAAAECSEDLGARRPQGGREGEDGFGARRVAP